MVLNDWLQSHWKNVPKLPSLKQIFTVTKIFGSQVVQFYQDFRLFGFDAIVTGIPISPPVESTARQVQSQTHLIINPEQKGESLRSQVVQFYQDLCLFGFNDIVTEIPIKPPMESTARRIRSQTPPIINPKQKGESIEHLKLEYPKSKLPAHSNSLHLRRKAILSGMTFNSKQSLIVWCSSESVRPDFVATVLGRFDKELDIRNRWVPALGKPHFKAWGGLVAVFRNDVNCLLAAKELKRLARPLKIILFSSFLAILIEAEIRHTLFGCSFTTLHIRGRQSFPLKQFFEVELLLYALGNIEFLQFRDNVSQHGVICEVVYAFASQAFTAKALLDGMTFKNVGSVTVEVLEMEKEKAILKNVKHRLGQFDLLGLL